MFLSRLHLPTSSFYASVRTARSTNTPSSPSNVAQPSCVHQVHTGGCCATTCSRSPTGYLDGLVAQCGLTAGGEPTYGDGRLAPHLPWVVLYFEEGFLVPSQQATFLGVMWDSTTLVARLPPVRTQKFLSGVSAFQPGTLVPYRTCMQVAGFMALAIHLVRLGRYHMRPFQKWMFSLRIPSSQSSRQVYVTTACARTLLP